MYARISRYEKRKFVKEHNMLNGVLLEKLIVDQLVKHFSFLHVCFSVCQCVYLRVCVSSSIFCFLYITGSIESNQFEEEDEEEMGGAYSMNGRKQERV
jgi:hypothetical protein